MNGGRIPSRRRIGGREGSGFRIQKNRKFQTILIKN
jgi:hypothetical protein